MKEAIVYFAALIAMLAVLWSAIYFISSRIEDIRVVEVEEGVHCAVTSRMMNTSIDCWKVDR